MVVVLDISTRCVVYNLILQNDIRLRLSKTQEMPILLHDEEDPEVRYFINTSSG
jgi:hypothetical protein